jgi:4-hydroxythreonine-4-phosphate dehydrogenase
MTAPATTPPRRHQIAITMGDPAGIGPEIVCRTLADMSAQERRRTRVIGDRDVLRRAARLVGASIELRDLGDATAAADVVAVDHVAVPDGGAPDGEVAAAAGEAAFQCVNRAVQRAQSGDIEVIVTAPINKAALHAAERKYDGHTGMLAALTGSPSSFMLLTCDKLATVHVSTHVSLREATDRATAERVCDTIRAGHRHMQAVTGRTPRIAVAGLNPHCGENGLFGREEIDAIEPGIQAARAEGIDVVGPVSGDTVFYRATRGEFDLVVAQYHDQGHIPIKLIAFDSTVNVSLGLPVKRTSVDHGTAFDIAWKGRADHKNMGHAIAYARRMAATAD